GERFRPSGPSRGRPYPCSGRRLVLGLAIPRCDPEPLDSSVGWRDPRPVGAPRCFWVAGLDIAAHLVSVAVRDCASLAVIHYNRDGAGANREHNGVVRLNDWVAGDVRL